MKELDELIEGVRYFFLAPEMIGAFVERLRQRLDAYDKAISTPPASLPEEPRGKRWERATLDGTHGAHIGDYYLNRFGYYGPVEDDLDKAFARGRGFVWRLVLDPEADSLEKIADDLEAFNGSPSFTATCASRIRALAKGEGK